MIPDLVYFDLHLSLLLLSLERLPYSISHGTFIKGLVGLDGHLNFVLNSDKEEASLRTVDCDLPNHFIKGLRV